MRHSFVVIAAALVAPALVPIACVSNDNPTPTTDGGTTVLPDGAVTYDAGSSPEASPPIDAAIDTNTFDAPAVDAPGSDEGAADANLPGVYLSATSTNVTAPGNDTIAVTLNGITATSIEIDDGATKIATLTASPYEKVVTYSFLENGTHAYTAKATLANSQVVSSAPLNVVVNIVPNGFFIDPVNGLDTNAGTQAAPFKTIAKAAALLTADGMSLYLVPATYDSTTQTTFSFTFPHATHLLALGAGVIIKGSGATQPFAPVFSFANGGEIRNVAFSGTSQSVDVSGGTFTASGCSFDSVSTPYSIRKNTVASIDETGVAAIATNQKGAGVGTVLVTDDGAVATFDGGGGTITGTAGVYVSPIFVRGHSTATVKNLTLTGVVHHAISLFDNGHLTLTDVNIDHSGFSISSGADEAVIAMGGENTEAPTTTSLVITRGGITASTGPALVLSLYQNMGTGQSITLTDTHLDSSAGQGLWVNGPNVGTTVPTITATNTTFNGNKSMGIDVGVAKLTLTGCSIGSTTGTPGDGIQFVDSTSASSFKMRSTTLASNAGDAIDFNGSAAATLDLGTAADLGGNTFSGVSGTFAAVHIENAITGQAVGNTWIAGQQGADANGHYTTATTLTTSSGAGSNAKLVTGASLVVE